MREAAIIPIPLDRIPVAAGSDAAYNEEFICNLVFEHPESLPIGEIDRAYDNLVPVCKELWTGTGYIDALYVTPTGRLVILEAKLWRNPEARRRVVAQILDYAKALSSWSYEDLQREVSKVLRRKGNLLYELAETAHPGLEEAQFVDEVQQTLRRGRFMLLIVGDGIREGAGAIANFLETVGSMEFTFGLVEVALYRHADVGVLVQPRVIARTAELQRIVVELPEGARVVSEPESASAEDELSDLQIFYTTFWKDFLESLELDDASQPLANVTKTSNIYFMMPPRGGLAWISAFFSKSKNRVGVNLRFANGNFGQTAYQRLVEDRATIDKELGGEADWDDASRSVIVTMMVQDVHDPARREDIRRFFEKYVNRFVNTFRPRLEQLSREVREA